MLLIGEFDDITDCHCTQEVTINRFIWLIIYQYPTFMEQLPDNAISINTDDKGIIATSVENEYALVSAVMEKSRKYKGKANEVIERVVKDARKSRFNVP